jgi:heat shock protein HtpX
MNLLDIPAGEALKLLDRVRSLAMTPPTCTSIPRRRIMTFRALFSLSLVVAFYGLVLVLAAACVCLPLLNLLYNDDPTLDQPVRRVLLFLIGVFMAGTMLWSVRPRRHKFHSPGPLVERSSHPRLFEELESIARALNERMPEEVYLLADVNAWVASRGGVMGICSRRVIGIGFPLLSILNVSQFRAVLAHEFGHSYRGDARLGPLVYKTRRAMVRAMENMNSLSFVTIFSPAEGISSSGLRRPEKGLKYWWGRAQWRRAQ